jgi:hypothetical protein
MKLGLVVHVCNLSHSGSWGRKILVCDQLGQMHKTQSEKQTKSKKDWGYGSSGRELEDLSSIPRTVSLPLKKERKEKKMRV